MLSATCTKLAALCLSIDYFSFKLTWYFCFIIHHWYYLAHVIHLSVLNIHGLTKISRSRETDAENPAGLNGLLGVVDQTEALPPQGRKRTSTAHERRLGRWLRKRSPHVLHNFQKIWLKSVWLSVIKARTCNEARWKSSRWLIKLEKRKI